MGGKTPITRLRAPANKYTQRPNGEWVITKEYNAWIHLYDLEILARIMGLPNPEVPLAEFARKQGVSKRHIYQLIWAGRIPEARKDESGYWLIPIKATVVPSQKPFQKLGNPKNSDGLAMSADFAL